MPHVFANDHAEKGRQGTRYWSIVENHRISGGRIVQKHVLYLGEINDSQREAWWRSIEILETGKKKHRKISYFQKTGMFRHKNMT